jgi:hypothetical protein
MKRFLVFLALIVIATVADSATHLKQFRILAGDATNPQTYSFRTTKGVIAHKWVMVAPDGGAMVKFKGLSPHQNCWIYLPAGTSLDSSKWDDYPVDSLTVLRDATTSSFFFDALGAD